MAIKNRIRRLALPELLLFALVAVLATWPLGRQIDRAIPLGKEPHATVPMLNVWTVWWNADRAQHFYAGYWDAPVFYPVQKTFTMSETQPLTVVSAPVLWVTGSRPAAYNSYLLLMLALNGWSAFHLLRYLNLHWLAALLGGLLVELLPFVHWKLGLLQCVPLCGIIWTIHALMRFGDRPSWLRGLLVGLAFGVTYHFCNYYGLFWSVLLILSAGWLLVGRLFEWRSWLRLLPSTALAATMILPFVNVQRQVAREHKWEREVDLVARLSAELADYTVEPVSRVPWPDFATADRGQNWPVGAGYAYYALAAIGLAVGVADRRRRRWNLFCLSLLVAAAVLSLGPAFAVGGWSPYQTLMSFYPGYKFVRSPYRFAVFVQLAVALSAGSGLHYAAVFSGCRRLKRLLPVATMLILGIAAAASIWPRAPKMFPTPSCEQNEQWITWLRKNTPPDSAIVCVPFVRGTSAAEFQDTTIWMYFGTYHRRALASGYSGYFPSSFFQLQAKMTRFPDGQSLDALAEYGVDYCVVRRLPERPLDIWRWPRNLRRVFSDETAGIDIYKIVVAPASGQSNPEEMPFR